MLATNPAISTTASTALVEAAGELPAWVVASEIFCPTFLPESVARIEARC
jgi:hypothetical protein